ncbi:MAG: hypothetical protein JO185_25415, partial [Acidobacteriaceae bacterium]|nr:hypothetical protein [Acidobacteriaceae bacterium]
MPRVASPLMVDKPEVEVSDTDLAQKPDLVDPRSLSRLLATALPLLSSRFPLAVTFGVDLLLPPRQHILRCDVAGGAVQT